MSYKGLIEILAVWDKIQIQTDCNLTDVQKEICKHCIDELKKKVQ